MPDIRRSKADLAIILADNTSEQISPQDVRDFMVSVLGGFSTMYVADGVAAQVVTGSPTKITGFVVVGDEVGFVADVVTNNRITVDIACSVCVQINCSFNGTSNKEFQMHIYRNGVDTGYGLHRKLGTGGDVGSVPAGGTVACAAGDYFEVFIFSPDGGISFTPVDMQLIVDQVG